MNLRDYQQRAVDATEAGWSHSRRQLGVAATGAGKTVIFSHLCARNPGRSLILAHREELVNQAVEKLRAATGIFATVERAGQRAIPGHGVVVGSVQTMARRLAKWRPGSFDLIVCDEAHHVPAADWQKCLSFFQTARVLGVTATPDRSDRRKLGAYFDSVAFEISLLELVRRGHLAPIRVRKLDVDLSLSALRGRKDWSADDGAESVSRRLRELAASVAAECWDRKTLIFLPRCDVSEQFAAALSACGIETRHVAGDSDDRARVLDWFARPGAKALCNAMLLTEGFDQPDVDCVLCLRPTKSRSLYSQIIGRGTRTAPGKEHLLVLDPLWLTGEHDLCRPADLAGGNTLHREHLQSRLEQGHELLEAEEKAQVDVEEALARELKAARKKKAPRGLIDPLAWSLAIHDGELAEWEPTMPWEEEPATPDQRKKLTALKIWPDDGMTRGYAVALLAKIAERAGMGLATPAQVMLMRRMGNPNAELMSQADAGAWIGERMRTRGAA